MLPWLESSKDRRSYLLPTAVSHGTTCQFFSVMLGHPTGVSVALYMKKTLHASWPLGSHAINVALIYNIKGPS